MTKLLVFIFVIIATTLSGQVTMETLAKELCASKKRGIVFITDDPTLKVIGKIRDQDDVQKYCEVYITPLSSDFAKVAGAKAPTVMVLDMDTYALYTGPIENNLYKKIKPNIRKSESGCHVSQAKKREAPVQDTVKTTPKHYPVADPKPVEPPKPVAKLDTGTEPVHPTDEEVKRHEEVVEHIVKAERKTKLYVVQLGVYDSFTAAEKKVASVGKLKYKAEVTSLYNDKLGRYAYHVITGMFDDQAEAEAYQKSLNIKSFVKQI